MTDSVYAWSQTAADNASADATVNFAEFQTPSSVNDSARALMARVAELVSDLAPKRTSTGSANAYAVTSDAAGATLRNGESITFIPHASNTGACTLNVAGRGAKNWRPKAATSFAADNILAGVPVTAYYNLSTDEWISPGTGYYVTNLASGVALQSITARLPQIGDLVVSLAPTPGAGRIRLTEATQSLLKADWPELNTWLSGHSYPWGSTATHFSLPPAAGYFLRFASTTSAIDTSGARAAGSVQTDQNKTASIPASGLTAATTVSAVAPTFRYNVSSVFQNGGGNAAVTDISTASGGVQVTTSSVTPTASTALSGSATLAGGDEVRTKNVAFHVEIVASSALAAAQVACFGLPYVWDAGTTAADPGSGRIRGNNATLASITQLYISKTDTLGVDLSATIATWTTGTVLNLSKVGAQGSRVIALGSGTATDNTTYYTIPVSITTAAGALSSNIAVEFSRNGSNGVTVPDPSGLSAHTDFDDEADFVVTYDTSASATQKSLGKNLGFTRSGASLRRLQSKLSDRADLRDWSGVDYTGATDSASVVQTAINAAAAEGVILNIAPGIIRLESQINIPESSHILGAGKPGANYTADYTYFHFAHTGLGFQNTDNAGSRSLRGFGTYRTQPAPGPGWAPTSHDWDIRILGGQDITIEDVHFHNATKAVQVRGNPTGSVASGRIHMNRLTGQPLNRGIDCTHCLDVVYMDEIHFWPFWQQNTHVYTYMRANAEGFSFGRVDNPKIGRLFCFGYYRGLNVYNQGADSSLPTGTVSSLSCNVLGADNCNIGLLVNPTVDNADIWFGSLYAASDPAAPSISPESLVYCLGDNCDVWIGSLYGQHTNASLVDVQGTGNKFVIGTSKSIDIDSDASGTAEFNAASTNIITLLSIPETSATTRFAGAGVNRIGLFGATSTTDNTLPRFDGTTGGLLQASGIVVDDSNNLSTPGSLKSSSGTGGIGYATGAGGTVTQATSKSTGVTLNKVCGKITLNNASLATATTVSFTLTNSTIKPNDLVNVVHSSGGTSAAYSLFVNAIADGSCLISVRNITGGSLSEAIVLTFGVLKAEAS